MKPTLKSTTSAAAIMSQKATKVEDNGAPIGNPHTNENERRKKAEQVRIATARGEVAGLVSGVTSEIVVQDNASGRGRALAIVTLALMYRNEPRIAPTKSGLSKDGDKNLPAYLTRAFAHFGLQWDEIVKKSEGINNAWQDAVAGFVWLYKTDCLHLLTSETDEQENGKYAHLGMVDDGKTYKLYLNVNKMAAAGVELDGEKVKADGGFARRGAMEIIKLGQKILNGESYWKKEQAAKELDVIDAFEAYCIAVAGGNVKPDNGPVFVAKTLERLKVVAVNLGVAIDKGEVIIAAATVKAENMKAEMSKSTEQKAIDAVRKPTAAEKKEAKRVAANLAAMQAEAEKIAAHNAKRSAKVTYLKTRKAKSVLKTGRRKAA